MFQTKSIDMDRQKIMAIFFATIMFTSMLAYGAAVF